LVDLNSEQTVAANVRVDEVFKQRTVSYKSGSLLKYDPFAYHLLIQAAHEWFSQYILGRSQLDNGCFDSLTKVSMIGCFTWVRAIATNAKF
jgi:hypothetical protein